MKRDGTDSTIKRRLEQELQTDDFYIRNVKEKEKGESRSSSLKIENTVLLPSGLHWARNEKSAS